MKGVFLGAAAGAVNGCAHTRPLVKDGAKRPNVVLIMTDDQGYGDLGIKGNPLIFTPNIDAMAARSAEMTNFYVSPVCAPTRACLMTGRYNYRTRCIDTYIGRAMMDPEEVTVAEVLRDAGYATGIFGKWHLGDNHPMRPQDQGFEEALVHRGGGIGQPSDPPEGERKYTNPVLFHNGCEVQPKGYCTDIYFESACDWIEKCRDDKRSFFAYIPTNAPHGPLHDVPQKLLEKYSGMDLSNSRFPQEVGHALPEKSNTDSVARIFSMITNIDENVGRLFAKLEELDITRDTIVIFMTDNGPNTRRYVAGMRGCKSEVYEGGIRSPFFMRWPGRLEAGCSSGTPAAHIDVMPTILDACGVEAPGKIALDGRSFLPLLEGRAAGKSEAAVWPDRTLVIQSHRGDVPVKYHHFAARSRRWKLLHPSGFGHDSFSGEPKFELYDMDNDPLETRDLAAERPEVVKSMREAYERWFEDVSTTRPDNYAPPRIHIGTPYENPVTLTRQDWRHIQGKPWAGGSNGQWMLHVARPGRYDIKARFPETGSPGKATLKIGGCEVVMYIHEEAAELFFENVFLHKGPANLSIDLDLEGKTKGPLQVDVLFLKDA